MAFSPLTAQPGQIEAFDAREGEIWDQEFQSLVESLLEFREQATIYNRRRDWLRRVGQRAKAELKEAFNGILAQTGFGWGLIQPEYLRATTTTNTIDWKQTLATTGWQDWLGSAATKNQINEDLFLAIIGLGNYDPSPKSIAVHLNIEGVTSPIFDFQFAVRSGIKAWGLPQPLGLSPKASIHWRQKPIATGSEEMYPFGIAYAESSYLQDETPTLQAP